MTLLLMILISEQNRLTDVINSINNELQTTIQGSGHTNQIMTAPNMLNTVTKNNSPPGTHFKVRFCHKQNDWLVSTSEIICSPVGMI